MAQGNFPDIQDRMLSVVSDCIGFSKYENYSLWHVMWFDVPELTYHTSSDLGVVCFMEFSSCLVTKTDPFLAFPDPSA